MPQLHNAVVRPLQPQWLPVTHAGLSGLRVDLRLPRAVCQCGGNVQLMFTGLLRPNQRLSNEVDAQIQHWGKMGHSLRDMKAELRHYYLGALGLHTLCARLDLTPGRNELETPPIVQIDAIGLARCAPLDKCAWIPRAACRR